MKGFLGGKKFENPFAKKIDRGGGKSLGGTKPGKVIPISLSKVGPIGIKLENTKNGTAIVAEVVIGTQSEDSGLQRGDIICVNESNGNEEIRYKEFLQMAKSKIRPLKFEVRRMESFSAASSHSGNSIRADDYARRQAVIAAAEARDKKNKDKKKPIARFKGGKVSEMTPADKKRIEEKREELAKKK